MRGSSDTRCDTVENYVHHGDILHILVEYADLFENIGLPEGDVHLETDSKLQPVQMPFRRLPIAVRDKVAAELQEMEVNGYRTVVVSLSAAGCCESYPYLHRS